LVPGAGKTKLDRSEAARSSDPNSSSALLLLGVLTRGELTLPTRSPPSKAGGMNTGFSCNGDYWTPLFQNLHKEKKE